MKGGFMPQLGAEIVKTMQKHHHELTSARDRIAELLADEETKFERTLANGLAMLNEAIDRAKAQGQAFIDGDTTFRLYDTFGFPLEMTREIAQAAGMTLDEERIREQLEAQRSRSRASAKFTQDAMKFGQFYAMLKASEGIVPSSGP